MPVTRSFDVSFVLRLNQHMSKNGDAGDLRRHPAHYEVIVMYNIEPGTTPPRKYNYQPCVSQKGLRLQ